MNEVVENEVKIENMIYKIRDKEVMLDSDLAKIYQVETKRINEAVKNNPEKFPSRYIFKITDKEYLSLKSKFSTSKGGSRKGHTAFTEQGVYMLATILKSSVATKVSIAIMDTFVKMRHYINLNKEILPNKVLLLEKRVDENTERINELFDKFDPKEILNSTVHFENQIYDAYSALITLFNRANEEIIIIDNYAGKELLDIVKGINTKIIIISANINNILKKKYESQYKNVTFINDNSYHDRIIVIDRKKVYLCGTSLKDFGKKFSVLTEYTEGELFDVVINKISKISWKI